MKPAIAHGELRSHRPASPTSRGSPSSCPTARARHRAATMLRFHVLGSNGFRDAHRRAHPSVCRAKPAFARVRDRVLNRAADATANALLAIG